MAFRTILLLAVVSAVRATNVVVFNGDPITVSNIKIGGVSVATSVPYRQAPVSTSITYAASNQQLTYTLTTDQTKVLTNTVGAATGALMFTYNGAVAYSEQPMPSATKANWILMIAASLGAPIHCYGRVDNGNVQQLTTPIVGSTEGAILLGGDVDPGTAHIKCWSTEVVTGAGQWTSPNVLVQTCFRYVAGQTVVAGISGNGQNDLQAHHNGINVATCAALGLQAGWLAMIVAALLVLCKQA